MQIKYRKSLYAISRIASIAAVAIAIVASVFATYSYLNANGGQIRTVSVTTTLTTITTTTAVTTTASTLTSIVATSHNRSSQLYDLTFNQTDPCKNFGTIIPWSVILTTSEGTYNITEPSNSSTPLSQCCWSTGSLAYSSIVFSVPNGTYFYEVYGNPRANGNVTVEGQDVIVVLQDEVFSCGSTTASTSSLTSSTSTNTITDNFENSSLTFLIWSNNTSVQNPISNITILTNNTVSCQVVRFDVSPMSYLFIHPAVIVNNNGSFFGLTYANGTQVSYLANASQDFYYTNGTVSGTIDMTFTLPAHGTCD